jgi:glucose-1-phosphatase
MKELNQYKNIIFDLGGVVLNLDYNQTVIEFRKYIRELDESVFLGKEQQISFFTDYEVGRLSTSDFRAKFRDYYQLSITDVEFDQCWNAMILDFPLERILLLQRLRQNGKKIFLLSNINELHEYAVEKSFSKLSLEYEFFDLFDKVYYSHQIGLRKPNQEIFEHVVNENLLAKDATIFIDDSLQHVLSARKCGIDAFHLVKPQTIETLIF